MSATNRDQWLAERRKGIGGSDIAALLGMSPFVWSRQKHNNKQKEMKK